MFAFIFQCEHLTKYFREYSVNENKTRFKFFHDILH